MSLPVVLLPGTLCDEQVWHKVVAELGPDQEVISKPLGAYRDWKNELAHLVKDLPERFVLVGFSLGGIAALAMLHQYPERVKKLVLVASTALADPPDSQARRRELLNLAEKNSDFKPLALMQLSPCDRQNMGDDGVMFVVQMAERFSVEQYACQTELACSRQDTRQCLAESQLPVHLIYGSEDTACGEDRQLLIRQACQQAVLYPVAGGGHWLPLSHSNVVAKVVLDALDSS
ncbi:alpha/beta fold hydrolase [Vibrio atlanticus]|uniref:alpha/beta fold hydrolase n=1 Tax=Vibrio atlanticus TaxID=693153 RepID=UPI0022AF0229|nr:alpha/beta hydrolase [Vibrio atlanticus]MCZ4311293.1 alpha/beta hydrolase [Vibrio atlanticus]